MRECCNIMLFSKSLSSTFLPDCLYQSSKCWQYFPFREPRGGPYYARKKQLKPRATQRWMLRLDSTLHQCFAMARSRHAGARKQRLSQWDVKGFPPSSPPADHNCHVSNAKSWANANAATGCHRYLVLFSSPDSSRLCLSQSPTHNSPCGAGTTPQDRQDHQYFSLDTT